MNSDLTQPVPDSRVTRWEYCTLRVDQVLALPPDGDLVFAKPDERDTVHVKVTHETLNQTVAQLGLDGWEMGGFFRDHRSDLYWFKRPILPGAGQAFNEMAARMS